MFTDDCMDLSLDDPSSLVSTDVGLGWRANDTVLEYVNNIVTKITTILQEKAPEAKPYIAGGAVRDLVYPIHLAGNVNNNDLDPAATLKDVDIFITNLPSDRKKVQDIFTAIKKAFLYSNIGEDGYTADKASRATSRSDENRFFVVDISPDSTNPNMPMVQIVEGKQDIETTVAHFDWYECAWWLPTIDSMRANRISIEQARAIAAPDMVQPVTNLLTLMHFHHPPKTLVRGFKLMQRHGFRLRTVDVQALATHTVLRNETYGAYLYRS